jgi:hypothetical protein
MNHKQNPSLLCLLLTAIALAGIFACALTARGQTPPNLVITAGSANLAPTLTLNSDSAMPWKAFSVLSSGTAGTNILWAESNGTTGGIYFGSVTTSTSGPALAPVGPPPPAPSDLPINTLTTAATAAIAGLPAEQVAKMAAFYENLGTAIDKGVIVSPLQLQIGTGTQLLSVFSADELRGFKNLTTAVDGWMDAQQCANKLTADRMDKYARTYHAVAAALGANVARGAGSVARDTTHDPRPTTHAPCPDGKCPAPAATPGPATRWRWSWR